MNFLGLFSALVALSFCQSLDVTYECPTGFVMNDDTKQCYYFEKSITINWEEAASACRDKGGYLLKINDKTEKTYIKGQMQPTKFWIGLNDKAVEGTYEFVDRTSEEVTYKSWAIGQPKKKFLLIWEQDCVEVNKLGNWKTLRCNQDRAFVCEADPKKVVTCPTDWVTNEEEQENIIACYKLMSDKKNHADAITSCTNDGGFLFYPTTINEGLYVETLVTGDTDYWIDIKDTEENPLQWMVTSTGLAPSHQNWIGNAPTSSTDKHCVAARNPWLIPANKAKWDNHRCSKELKYVCKMVENEVN